MKTMKIEDLWAVIEADADAGKAGAGGWLLRLGQPTAGCPLFVGLELSTRRRAILLRLPSKAMPSRRRWPRSKGLEALAVVIDDVAHFGVALKETRFSDVFTALTADLIRRVSDAANPDAQALAFLGQLSRWQKFLSASADGLGDEAQRGLWGELQFLRELLQTQMGITAVYGWKGPEKAHQDFQFKTGAVEIKATLAKQPQVVRITSERQLDDSAWPALFLNVFALDIRDGSCESLPAMVASIRSKVLIDAAAQEQFEDALLAAGYLDIHAIRYADRGYTIRSQRTFRVRGKFPRLVEMEMPEGVGDTNYGLSIAACGAFAVTLDELNSQLASVRTTKKTTGSKK